MKPEIASVIILYFIYESNVLANIPAKETVTVLPVHYMKYLDLKM